MRPAGEECFCCAHGRISRFRTAVRFKFACSWSVLSTRHLRSNLVSFFFSWLHSHNLWEECLKVEIDIDAPWNEGARLEVEDWLTSSQSNEDRQRLFCMGNIVVPLRAKIGLGVIADIQAKTAEV